MRAVIPILCIGLAACGGKHERFADAKAILSSRCGACHQVPGVLGAAGNVGPSLAGIARRQVLAGYFPNNRSNLIYWITRAQEMKPGNAMPNTGLSSAQASEVADYLYTLDR